MLITLKTYSYASAKDPDYIELRAALDARGLPFFNVNAMRGDKEIPAGEYEVDTAFLWSDQTNTIATEEHKGFRVFDWYEGIYYANGRPTALRRGHYIEEGPGYEALQQARREQFACGYCGARYHSPEIEWCTKCRGSEYLKPADYPLLRLRPVIERHPIREGLPPAGVLASISFDHAAADKARVRKHIEDRRELTAVKAAQASLELRFRELCAEAGLTYADLQSLLAYTQPKTTDLRFVFGWREPVSDVDVTRIRAALSAVHAGAYNVEFKTA